MARHTHSQTFSEEHGDEMWFQSGEFGRLCVLARPAFLITPQDTLALPSTVYIENSHIFIEALGAARAGVSSKCQCNLCDRREART